MSEGAHIYLGHSENKAGRSEFLSEHLRGVAERMKQYTEVFGAGREGYVTGLLHDIGKYGELYQRRLAGLERGIDHWSAGAWLALTKYQLNGVAMALAIQGHHIGLQRSGKALQRLKPDTLMEHHPLNLRMSEADHRQLEEKFMADGLVIPGFSEIKDTVYSGLKDFPASGMLDVRMLFSALVDADYLETEAHFQAGPGERKKYRPPGLSLDSECVLPVVYNHLAETKKESRASSEMNRLRADLLSSCVKSAQNRPGIFTLSAPTGSGKTLSMLAFALEHAGRWGLQRVIMIIPYLTIIEQTANTYKKIFRSIFISKDVERYILEHHSLAGMNEYEDGKNLGFEDDDRRHIQFISENWDAPIIITTSVQFLESLFSNRPFACRKLHRLANSVILFDEVQTIPTALAIPTLATLSRLSERYGATVLFSTATQPAFSHLDETVKKYCFSGWSPKEIVPPETGLFKRMRRTYVQWPENIYHSTGWQDLADRLLRAERRQGLCIVNLKRHASHLLDILRMELGEGLFHLSTNMCPAHRSMVLDDVRQRLKSNKTCLLISTQCIEAGVDVDFPSVFRAFGPLDAIVQAAGRCNRNGNLDVGGVVVFIPEERAYPDRGYEQATDVTAILFRERGAGNMDINDTSIFTEYYRRLYKVSRPESQNKELYDAINIQDFKRVSELYRLIDQDTINVVVPHDLDIYQELSELARENGLSREWIAKARLHSIGLFRPKRGDIAESYLEPIPVSRDRFSEDWYIYRNREHYDSLKGLIVPRNLDLMIA